MIRAEHVCFRHPHGFTLRDVCLEVRRGELFGIIGPNGSGKSTLVRLLSGIDRPMSGSIRVNGRDVRSYSRKALSRLVAVLPQEPLPAVGFSVREVIGMGRYPYQNWLGREKVDAGERVDAILRELDLKELEHRRLDTLSGGERQRAALGKVMAQEPAVLLLDEPTNSLDIGHTVALMESILRWKKKSDLTVIAVLHDLNLAAQFCDRLLLMHRGEAVRIGTAEEVIEEGILREVYGICPVVLMHPVDGCPQVLMRKESMGKEGRTGHDGRRAAASDRLHSTA